MLVLVAVFAMQPLWAVVVAAAVFVERNLPRGEFFSLAIAAALVLFGGAALIQPALIEGRLPGVMT